MRAAPIEDTPPADAASPAGASAGFGDARWIARGTPLETRIVRQIVGGRTDWAEPGHPLGQAFIARGPVTAVNVTLTGPREGDPFEVAVDMTLRLTDASGSVVAERTFTGPQLVWDFFGPMLDVSPPAPPGEYVLWLDSREGAIGWDTAEVADDAIDDGISPLPVEGPAYAGTEAVPGVRTIGIDTVPAPNPVFRRTLVLDAPATTATLAASVLGTGVVRVNGVRVGEGMLEPAVTDYDRTVLFRTHDVAHLLRAGENEITIEAGRERYAARGGDVWGWHLAPWSREPVALLRLAVSHPDGSTTVVGTDAQWSAEEGPVVERLFRGEDWTLGARPVGAPALEVSAPRGELTAADVPPVRAGAPLPPIVVEPQPDGSIVYDFGSVMVGRIRADVRGRPGAVVTVRAGEQRAADGAVVCDNFLVAGETQLDTLTFAPGGEAQVTWEPQFGYRGFRWLQVGTADGAEVADVRAVPLYSDLEVVGELTASDPVLEWIDTATARTFRNNLHGIPTDTPIYEKNGWTADAHLATEGLLHHFDLRQAFGKWMRDHADAQASDGSMPQIIPTPGWGRASDPTWSSSAVFIPWYLYREYGDPAILRSAAPMIRRFADQVLRVSRGGVWPGRTWGDWLAPDQMVGPEGMSPVGTAMTVALLRRTADVLGVLGEADAAVYARAADGVAAAYHETWFDPATGGYRVPGVAYRQVLDILPLAFGITPPGLVAGVRARLVEDIENRTDGHLDTGAVGVRHLLPVLEDAGRDDLAITVLTRRTRPGWGAWYAAGESTLLESWDVDARSRNHYFLGSVSAWIQQRVGGMRLTEPGWSRFRIKPVDDDRLTSARIAHRTPLGDASVAWERGPGGWRFDVSVPDGAVADLRVPGSERVLESGVHRLLLP